MISGSVLVQAFFKISFALLLSLKAAGTNVLRQRNCRITQKGRVFTFLPGGPARELAVNRTRAPFFSFTLLGLLLSSLLTGCGGGSSSGSGGGGGGTPQNIPVLTAIAPSGAVAGATAVTLALYGSNFEGPPYSATVQWNGTALPFTWISATQMTATIPASDIAAVGNAKVTVTNPGSGGGISTAQTFTISAEPAATTWVRTVPGITPATTPDLAQNIVWDGTHGKLYLAIPSTATSAPNTIAVIDPIAGAVTTNVAAGNNPDLLSISSDSSYLWAGLDGADAVQRYLLPGLTPDISFPVPPDSSGNPQQPVSLQAAPVSPHSLALIAGQWNTGPASNAVYVYDDTTPRPVSFGESMLQWVEWGADDSTMYGISDTAGDAVDTLTVKSGGVSLASEKGGGLSSARGQEPVGTEPTQYDTLNGLLYCYTFALNTADGSQVGWFNTSPAPFNTAYGPQACTADPSLGRFYCVESGSFPDYELFVFDLNSYALLDHAYLGAPAGSQSSPITGYPHHLVRWGNAGLALATETYGGMGNGGFFLIDGAAVNPSAVADVSSGTTTWSYPWMASLSPQQAPAGSGDVPLTINGKNFTSDSTAYWKYGYGDAAYLPTTYITSQQLNVTIPASLLVNSEMAPITVFDSGSNLYSTDSLTFTVTSASVSGSSTQVNALNVAAFAMAWDPTSALLYVGTTDFDGSYPNSIVAISGESGSVVKTQTVGPDPWTVSAGANGQYLYVGYFSATTMTQLPLPGLASPVTWALTNPDSPLGYYAEDLQAAPVNPHTTAVTLGAGGLVIYDDNVERPDFAGPYYTLAWGPSDQTLTAAPAGGPISGLQVSSSGVAFEAQGSDNSFNACGGEIHSDFGTGLIYSDCGNVADPTTLATVGTYNASGLVAPDSSLDRVFILGQTAAQANTNNFTVESFDEKAYTPVSSITIENVGGSPLQLVRWGTSGLAVLTLAVPGANVPGMLYLIQDATFVSSAPAAAFKPSNTRELVQQRWKRITKADIAKIVKARQDAELP